MATVKEFREQHPNALVLYVTKNRTLRNEAQSIAANSFGFHVEADAPKPGIQSGVYGVSYVGLLNDKIYKNTKWDLVVADESGEARNWFKDENQQGKMLIDVIDNARKALYVSATPFHSPNEYGYLKKLHLWENGQFDKWIENNFAHEKVKDKIVARLDPAKQAKLRQQLIERGQLVSQAISYEGLTAHFGVVPVTDEMKRGLDRIREGFARARDQLQKMGKKGLAEKAAAFEATYTKAFLEERAYPTGNRIGQRAMEPRLAGNYHVRNLIRRLVPPHTGRQRGAIHISATRRCYGRNAVKESFHRSQHLRQPASRIWGPDRDYSGRGNTMAARESAKNGFPTWKDSRCCTPLMRLAGSESVCMTRIIRNSM